MKARWNNIRMMAELLWWAIALPDRRFYPRLLAFCRALLEGDDEAQREQPARH
jgi:hypothetical protein